MKYSIGKISLLQPFESFIDQQVAHNGFQILDIHWTHVAEVSRLPLHHRDPFDRLIIAQSLVERFPVVGRDPAFDRYGVQRLW